MGKLIAQKFFTQSHSGFTKLSMPQSKQNERNNNRSCGREDSYTKGEEREKSQVLIETGLSLPAFR